MRQHLYSLYTMYGIQDPMLFEELPRECERQWNIYWDLRDNHCEPGVMGGETPIKARHFLEWQELNEEVLSRFDKEAIMLMDRTYAQSQPKGDDDV